MKRIAWLALLPGIAHAGSVTLTWDQVPDARVTGYEVGYGTKAGEYTISADAKAPPLTIPNLPTGARYFFAVRAHGADRAYDSAWSNEVSAPIRFDTPGNFKVVIEVSVNVQ